MFAANSLQIAPYFNYARTHFPALLQPRPADSHKGMFGTLVVIGGTEGMAGAPLLAGSAALYAGCGKVLVGFNQGRLPMPIYSARPELMLDTAENAFKRPAVDCWVIGCGLGQNQGALESLQALWRLAPARLVCDADALRLLAAHAETFSPQPNRTPVLTPHPAEAAHLLQTDVATVQRDRVRAARAIALRYQAWAVLKGHHTVIAGPNDTLHINRSGNAGLATAGSGDVLAGMIGSLLAQKIPPEEAIPAAVWLHGAASEILQQAQIGQIGMLAGEIAEAARWLRNRLVSLANS